MLLHTALHFLSLQLRPSHIKVSLVCKKNHSNDKNSEVFWSSIGNADEGYMMNHLFDNVQVLLDV